MLMRPSLVLLAAVPLLCACGLPFGLSQFFSARYEKPEPIRFWVGTFDDYAREGIHVGCDSWLLPVATSYSRSGDAAGDLRLALEALFDPVLNHASARTEDWVKDLALYVESINISDGFAEALLGGRLRGIGTCGDAILEAQILQTIFQFNDIKSARVSDGNLNLRQIVDMSDRLSADELKAYIYRREDLDWLRG